MDDSEIYGIIRPIVLLVTGVPICILADPNQKAPSGPYATIRPKQRVTERGQADVIYASKDENGNPYVDGEGYPLVKTEIRSKLISECSVNFYREGAQDFAYLLKQADKRPDVFETLFKANVGWRNAGPVQNLTALQSNQQEQRSQISIFLMYEGSQIVDVNSIERSSIEVFREVEEDPIVTINVETPDAPPQAP